MQSSSERSINTFQKQLHSSFPSSLIYNSEQRSR